MKNLAKIMPTLGLIFIVMLAACSDQNSDIGKDASGNDDVASVSAPVEWPSLTSAVSKDPALEAKIDALLAKMTPEQKVGQLIQPELRQATPADIKKYHIGSVLNGGGAFPNDNKNAS